MDFYLAMIMMFGGNFNLRGWLFCDGSLLSIAQNTAFFSLLGTMYGGDGQTTFAIPDLRGRVPIGMGQGAGLQNYTIGEKGGAESTLLAITNLPGHNHSADQNLIVRSAATTAAGTSAVPGPTLVPALLPRLGGGPSATTVKGYGVYDGSTTMEQSIVSGAVGFTGGSQPFDNRSPYLVMNYIICSEGLYPPRS